MQVMHLARKVLIAATILTAGTAWSQNFPSKPVRIVVGGAGSGTDVMTRLIAQGISPGLGQPVVVDTRGGSPIIIADIVRKAPADGYTLLVAAGSFMLLPYMRDDVPYDPVKDFSPITLAVQSPTILIVPPSLGVKNVKELVALAKAKPGQLNYGVSTSGSSTHLSAELLKSMTGINIVRINYKGAAPAQTALLSGEIQISFGVPYTVMPFIKAGKMVGLGVSTAEPTPLAPGMPTIASQGLPGYESTSTIGMFAPAGTPTAVINRLNQEVVRFLKRPDIEEKLSSTGADVVASTPQEFAAKSKADMVKMGKVIKDAGIRDE